MPVYITDISAFLPNDPVSNDQMESLLGMVQQLPSRTRRIILRNNKIKTRYYAIDPKTGLNTHTNAQMTAAAVRKLSPYPGFSLRDIDCLCCGTSSPDQLMPGHGVMVHGELKNGPCEVGTAAGICVSGMSALKYAYMAVALGEARSAVATGSELASSYMRSRLCGPASDDKVQALEKQPVLSFGADFLRWMLSDGAGAAFLSDSPGEGTSLRIDWINLFSFAHELPTCMYAGGTQNSDGTIRGWREQKSLEDSIRNETFLIKQDVKLLNQEIITTAVERTLPELLSRHEIIPEEVDWFLPHYSSDFFRQGLHDRMRDFGFHIPMERWFTNLPSKGNTGAASIYIILEELFHSGKLKKGERILCFIPESGRFSMCYMMLTVV